MSDGAGIALLAGTLSEDGSAVVDSVLRQLGPSLASRCRVFEVPKAKGGKGGRKKINKSQRPCFGAPPF